MELLGFASPYNPYLQIRPRNRSGSFGPAQNRLAPLAFVTQITVFAAR